MQPNVSQDLPTKRLSISLSESAERQLRQRANDEGLDLEEFARAVLERETNHPTASQTPNEWITEWRAWTANRPRQESSLDDSRASIYE